jgi:transposase
LELPLSIEECHALITQLLALTARQSKQIESLTLRIKELESRLNQNSKNSSQPPSRDIKSQKPGIPKEPKTLGGQKEHEGNTLRQVENPDAIIRLTTDYCSCGLPLDKLQGSVVQVYQEFDLPEPKLHVTEYRRLEQPCSCGLKHLAPLPDHIQAPVQYGPGVRALTVLLNNSCQLSFEKTSTLFHDLFGYDLNESTAINNNIRVYEGLENTEASIKAQLLGSEVVHFDETGIKVSTKRIWLHVQCNALYTHLFVHALRGGKAHEPSNSILSKFKNWAIHDCYGFYFTFTQCLHAICNPHILRELQAQIEEGKDWAMHIQKYLLELYKSTSKGTVPVKDIASEKEKWQKLCVEAIKIEELLLNKRLSEPVDAPKKRGRKERGKPLSLLDRLLKHSDAILAFAQYAVVPFSNNQAERDIRPSKTKQKVAGCFRTIEGANRYARIQGFISTCRKQNFNVFKELRAVCTEHILYKAPFEC